MATLYTIYMVSLRTWEGFPYMSLSPMFDVNSERKTARVIKKPNLPVKIASICVSYPLNLIYSIGPLTTFKFFDSFPNESIEIFIKFS